MSSDAKPRKKRTPSPRDQAIYVAYRSQGVTQEKLATENALSQTRISAIVRRIDRWLATPCDAGVSPALHSSQIPNPKSQIENTDAVGACGSRSEPQLDHASRLHLDQWLARQRSQAVFDRALRAFDHGPRELTTHKQGERGGKPFHEETRRQQPPNMQALRVAARTSADLARVAERTVGVSPASGGRQPTEVKSAREVSAAPPSLLDQSLKPDFWAPRPHPTYDPATCPSREYCSPHTCGCAIVAKYGPQALEPGFQFPDDPVPDDNSPSGADSSDPTTNCFNPTTPDSSQLPTTSDLPIKNPQSQIPNHKSPPLTYEQKILLLKNAQRRGLPIMVEFGPDEKPPPFNYHLDGYHPPPDFFDH